jgi:hypothetical protein
MTNEKQLEKMIELTEEIEKGKLPKVVFEASYETQEDLDELEQMFENRCEKCGAFFYVDNECMTCGLSMDDNKQLKEKK